MIDASPAPTVSCAEDAKRPRDTRIDALRGLAIVLVVLGHSLVRATAGQTTAGPGLVDVPGVGFIALSTASSPLLNLIYSFHIPLFAFVSGMVLAGSSRGFGWDFVKRRFMGLMVPYFAWLFIGWLSVGVRTPLGLAQFMLAGALNPQSPGSLWFLYALFMSALILAGVKRVSNSEWALIASAIAVGVAGVLPVGGYDHLLGLADVAWVYPFFVAGLIFASHRRTFDNRALFWLPLSAVVWLSTLPLVSPLLVPGPRWWFSPIAAAFAQAGLPAAFVVCKGVWAVAREAGALGGVMTFYFLYAYVTGWARDIQAWLGQRSIGIYALHSAFFVAFGAPWGWQRAGVLFVSALSGSILATLVLERFKWTRVVLLGRAR